MKHAVYVDGQDGTTGLRIHEYLATRSDIEVLRIDPSRRKDAAERAHLLNSARVAFLCLPDAAAREAAALVTNPETCLIDASTAHRTASGWTYGLPELAPAQRDALRKATRISNPGCHATAFLLLVRPLIDAGLLTPDAQLSATSITGYSGGGRSMIERYEAATHPMTPKPYALGLSHKHLPEMTMYAGLQAAPVFVPVVGSFYKGLAVSVPLHRSQWRSGADPSDLRHALRRHYEVAEFVRVMPLGDASVLDNGFFDVEGCNGTNRADVFVFASDTQAVLMCRIDNLGKGASGAAVQSMNLVLGVDEGTGLR